MARFEAKEFQEKQRKDTLVVSPSALSTVPPESLGLLLLLLLLLGDHDPTQPSPDRLDRDPGHVRPDVPQLLKGRTGSDCSRGNAGQFDPMSQSREGEGEKEDEMMKAGWAGNVRYRRKTMA